MADDAAHILVVDDDTRLRDLLKEFLAAAGFRVTVASSADEARAKMAGLDYDLLVLDVMMPGETGIAFTRALRDAGRRVPILMLTAMAEADDRIQGFESGVDDYLPKPFEPRELVLRIHAILRRMAAPAAGATAAADVIVLGACRYDPKRGELSDAAGPVKLTSTEQALLDALAAAPGAAISRQELADKAGINSDRAVDVQVTRLRKKLEADPRNPRYLRTVWGEGYALIPDA